MTIVFDGVSVVPMDSERVVADQAVVVDGDRITWIGPVGQAEIPSGAVRVDGRGKYLMPGLADMHCHPGAEDDLLLLVVFGVTTTRNLEGMPRHVRWRDRVAAGELLGPTIFTTGPIVEGRPVRCNGMQSVVDRDEALAAVALTDLGGYELGEGLRPAVRRGVPVGGRRRPRPWAAGGRAHPLPGRPARSAESSASARSSTSTATRRRFSPPSAARCRRVT